MKFYVQICICGLFNVTDLLTLRLTYSYSSVRTKTKVFLQSFVIRLRYVIY